MKKRNKFSIDDENFIPTISNSEKEAFVKGIVNKPYENKENETMDPKGKPVFGINVRFNQYQMDLIRRACLIEERSQQQVIKRILIPVLESIVSNKR